jgi:superfamily II DNA or RNA helicase
MSKKDNINLEINGKLFPSWVLLNFKKYQLPEIKREKGEDPCNEKIKKEITKYQEFLGKYLSYNSPFKDILVYHGLGSGKTVSAINIYNVLFNSNPKWNVFLLIKASLKNDPWMKDLNEWLEKNDKDQRFSNIKFVHYDSPFADRDFLEVMKKADASRENLFIFDEVHNFIRNVYNNISSKTGKRAQVIYDYIQQEKKDNPSTRIVLLSATPAVNNPYELALIFNLMRPGTFPTSEAIFNQKYISSTNFQSLNDKAKNQFQRRIMGLVSYYIGATPDKFAKKTVHYKNLVMSEYQQEVYDYLEEIEEKKEQLRKKMSRGKIGNDMSTYASYTRQAANFVFPNINSQVNGERRPRPAQFKIKDKEAVTVDEGKNKKEIQEFKRSKEEIQEYVKACRLFVNETINYFKNIHREDKEKGHTLTNDVKNFFEKYKGSFTELMKEGNKRSRLLNMLYRCSPKMTNIVFNILKSPGSTMVYSNYVEMEGLQMFKVYLQFFGFGEYVSDAMSRDKSKDGFRYTEYHGGIDKETREKAKSVFNSDANKYGKIIKIIMISPAGAEGINLANIRQVHIMEPYWNEVRIEQVIGRAIRQCIHKALPMDERTVDVFRYKVIRRNGKVTADENMENISRRKNNLLISFIESIKEVAVDCELFKNINMMGSKYQCFKFNEQSLFEKNVGPAYNPKYEYDDKMDDGLNAMDSFKKRIKVKKIKIVKKIGDNNYSESINAWLYEDNGVVYDYELDFPIGKVLKDNTGQFNKLDKNTYIVEDIIKIPVFKYY